jgi:hypothetical protein
MRGIYSPQVTAIQGEKEETALKMMPKPHHFLAQLH